MGQESAQLEARFRAFNGGAIEAAKSLDIMTAAVNGALTKDDQMLALNRVMGSGLVTTAEQAAQLAQAALLLSSETGNATEKVMGLTQALLSGRDRALIPYGINIEEFRRRVAELTTGEDELSKSQAALECVHGASAGPDGEGQAGGRRYCHAIRQADSVHRESQRRAEADRSTAAACSTRR